MGKIGQEMGCGLRIRGKRMGKWIENKKGREWGCGCMGTRVKGGLEDWRTGGRLSKRTGKEIRIRREVREDEGREGKEKLA